MQLNYVKQFNPAAHAGGLLQCLSVFTVVNFKGATLVAHSIVMYIMTLRSLCSSGE